MKTILYPSFLLMTLLSLTTSVHSELATVNGKVGMTGQIYDSACTIDTATLDQTISMGNTPVHELFAQGVGSSKFFNIRLLDCDFGKNPNGVKGDLSITFNGVSEGDAFMVSGEASGVGLNIYNESQLLIKPGVAMALSKNPTHVTNNVAVLTYQLQLVRVGMNLSSGEYYTTLNFKLDYN